MATPKPPAEQLSNGALQILLRCERDSVQSDVEPAPRPADLLEDRFQLPRLAGRRGARRSAPPAPAASGSTYGRALSFR